MAFFKGDNVYIKETCGRVQLKKKKVLSVKIFFLSDWCVW